MCHARTNNRTPTLIKMKRHTWNPMLSLQLVLLAMMAMPSFVLAMHRRAGAVPAVAGAAGAVAAAVVAVAGAVAGAAGLTTAHQEGVDDTEEFESKSATRTEHRNRTRAYITWLDEKYPGSDQVLDCDPSQLKLEKVGAFYSKEKRRLNYSALNIGYLKAFMATKKIKNPGAPKAEQKYCSYEQVRKFRDAVKRTAPLFKENNALPDCFDADMKLFLSCVKKEIAAARQRGQYDESASDPIPFALYRYLASWALMAGNICFWVFLLLQWNLMCRSCNVASIGLHHFKVTCECLTVGS